MEAVTDPAYREWLDAVTPELAGARAEALAMLAALPLDDGFLREFREKTAHGWVEHDGGIRFMSEADLLAEVRAELLDLLAYLGTIRAARR